MQSLCNDDNKNIALQFQKNKKLSRLLKIALIINEVYTPSHQDFIKCNMQFELVKHYFQEAYKKFNYEQYYLIYQAYTLQYLFEYITEREMTEDKIQAYININDLEGKLANTQFKGLAVLVIQLLIELYFIQQKFNLEHIFDLHDQIYTRDLQEKGYSLEKINDYREIVASLKQDLSPITDAEENCDIDTQENIPQQNKNIYFYPEIFQNQSSIKFITQYMINAISTNNKDLIAELKFLFQTQKIDLISIQILEFYLSPPQQQQTLQQIEQFIQGTDFKKVYDLNLILLYSQIICYKTEQIKLLSKKAQEHKILWAKSSRLQMMLVSKFQRLPGIENNALVELVDQIIQYKLLNTLLLDFQILFIQIAFNIIFSKIIECHIQDEKKNGHVVDQQLQLLLKLFEKLILKINQDNMWDIVVNYINNCLSKSIIECIQSIFIKSVQMIQYVEYTQLFGILTYIIQFAPAYELNYSDDIKSLILKLTFKREKQLQIHSFDNLSIEDQLQFRYSKLYKKQYLYYHLHKNYNKSIRQTLKYFQAYLCQPSFSDYGYLQEELVVKTLFQNFNLLGATLLALISSQFLSKQETQNVDQNLEINEELAQFFFDAQLIQKLCPNNPKIMVKRMQDPDSYSRKSILLEQQTKEKYLHLFINYLMEKILIK
ncbi:hypothetical protein pb186bvf_013256 [Paramecium bursaria]